MGSPDGEGILLYRQDEGADNIWRYTLSTGEERKVTDFEKDNISWFAVAPDGEQLTLSRGNVKSDMVVLKNFH